MSPRHPTSAAGPARHLSDRFHADGTGALSRERLVVLLYQRLLRDLYDAVAALEERDPEPAHRHLVHAQAIVAELDGALDLDAWDGAATLSQLYRHLLDRLVTANVGKQAEPVHECIAIVAPMAEAWTDAWVEVSTPAGRPDATDPSGVAAGAAVPADPTGALDVLG